MTPSYRITFTVPNSESLGNVLGVLSREIRHFEIEECDSSKRDSGECPTKDRWQPFISTWETTGACAKAFFANIEIEQEFQTSTLSDLLEREGLSRSSASPTLSRLRALDYVKRIGPNTYKRIK